MSRIRVHLFGKFSVRRDDRALTDLEAPKVQELFSYLLLHRDRVHCREVLAGALWGDTGTAQARKYLRQALWQLQTALGANVDGAEESLLLVEPDWVRINARADLWLDVALFEAAAARAQGVPVESLPGERAGELRAAVEVYRGDLLEACYQDWCLFERERLQNLYLTMLDKLMGYCEAQEEYEEGLLYGDRILRCDRARERTHRRLMRLHYLAGDRTAALRQYERCVAVLEEELNVPPARSTLRLYQQIREDRLDGPEPPSAPTGGATDTPADSAGATGHLEQLRAALIEIEQRVQQDIHALNLALEQ